MWHRHAVYDSSNTEDIEGGHNVCRHIAIHRKLSVKRAIPMYLNNVVMWWLEVINMTDSGQQMGVVSEDIQTLQQH